MANSRPDLVPLNESFGSDKKKNDYISPKIKSLLETLGMFSIFSPSADTTLKKMEQIRKQEKAKPKEKSLAEYYHDTLKISPLKNRNRHNPDGASSKSFQRRTNNGYTGNGEISILTGEDRKTSPRPLIESIISGGGKITSWRQSGKIRSWPRQKLFSRIKEPFKTYT